MIRTEEQRRDKLRSGKYPQAQGRLRKAEGYCCLGVACDISEKGRWVMTGVLNQTYSYQFETDCGQKVDEDVYLPPIVQDVFGFHAQNPQVGEDYLADLNDHGLTFAEIADRIEQEYLS